MKKIAQFFLQGILYTAPIAITVYIIYLIFKNVDGFLQKWIQELFDINIPGLGIVIIVSLLILIGFIGQTFIARPFKYLFNKLLEKIPLLKVIYSAFKDLFTAFVGDEKKFNKSYVDIFYGKQDTVYLPYFLRTKSKISLKMFLKYSFLITSTSIIICIVIFGYYPVKDTILLNPTKQLLSKDWYTSQYGSPPVELKTPNILVRVNDSIENNKFEMGNFEDNDYCLRATENNFDIYVSHSTFVYHYGSSSFDGKTFSESMNKNKKLFDEIG